MSLGGFDEEWLNKLREANDLVALMSTYMPLKRMGRKYWANCPFHHEKSPSLCINEDEQYYHCFGCGESGNVISFVMKMESLDFLDAINFLAKRCGMEVPTFSGNADLREKKKKKDRALALMSMAKEYYKQMLKSDAGKPAMDYLISRGITPSEIEKFELGYSASWEGVIDEARKNGFRDEELKEFGLETNAEGRVYDFFAKRLMFPIHNRYGDCVGFSGRDMEGRSHAKYKNSPQSLIFDKSNLIYGLHLVKKLKSEELKSVILCEGQMDVIAMHKAGFDNSMACLGTALTEAHAREIEKLVDKVYLCFDGDSAGQHATQKAISVLKNYNLSLRVVPLPIGKDPDEVIKEKGKDALSDLISKSVDSVEFEIKYLSQSFDLRDNLGKSKFLKEAIKYLRTLDLEAQRDIYIPLVSELTNVSSEVIRRDLQSGVKIVKQEVKPTFELQSKPDALLKAQRFILSSMLHKEPYVRLEEDFKLNSKNMFYNDLYAKLYKLLSEKKDFAIATIIDETKEIDLKQLNEIIDVDLDNFEESREKYYKDCIKNIKIFNLTQREEELKAMINQEPDLILRSKLLANLQEISKQKYKIRMAE